MITTDNKTLIAENVEIDMSDLEIARCVSYHPIIRERAHQRIINAVIKGLEPKDRKRLEAYEKEG